MLILSTQLVWAADYYVTEDGAGGTCIAGSECSAAEFNLLSGDYSGATFYFSGTFTTRITVNIYGTSGSPVTLDGYEAGSTAPLTDIWASSNGALLNLGIYFYPVSYLTMQDFRITDTGSAPNAAAGAGNGMTHFIFRRNYIYDTGSAGFYMGTCLD